MAMRPYESGSFAAALQGSFAANRRMVVTQQTVRSINQPVHLFLQGDHFATQALANLPSFAECFPD